MVAVEMLNSGIEAKLLDRPNKESDDERGAGDRMPDVSSIITQVTKWDLQQQQLARQNGGVNGIVLCNQTNGISQQKGLYQSSNGHNALLTTHTSDYTVQQQGATPSEQPGGSWRFKVKQLFCCFSPQSMYNGYVRSKDFRGLSLQSHPSPYPLAPAPPVILNRPVSPLIGPKAKEDLHKKTLVLDLDETLVHSSFKPIVGPDFVIPVDLEGKQVDVYVLKRPWLDQFMEAIGHRYEIVVFTASLAKYADPLLDLLDKWKVVKWRLFRESCVLYDGNYVKDLSCLGRNLSDIIIVDNSPNSYCLQPGNALPIGTFIDDMRDSELLTLLPVLHDVEQVHDVRPILTKVARTGMCIAR